jgi:lantibiotic leader peptide-processing serine protease
MRLNRILCWSGSALLVGLTACQDSPNTAPSESPAIATAKTPKSYVISLSSAAPVDLATRIERAGGKVKKLSKKAGVATVESAAPNFEAELAATPGVESVVEDRVLRWISPRERGMRANIGSDETFFNAQWAPKAVHAPEAWNAGARGTGVRVAVLDGGLNRNHDDLRGSVDTRRSASFVKKFAFYEDVDADDFSHATHVAGIIAAQDDGAGTIGIAPGTTIIGVKVLHEGSGSFGDIIDGIIYAATPIKDGGAGADIINMSLGAEPFQPTKQDAKLIAALNKATTFAHDQGVVVIAAAGNEGVNLDNLPGYVVIPAQSDHVIAVSATGPFGFAVPGSHADPDRQASYTNFGRSLVDFAAPGGDFALPDDVNGDGQVNDQDLCTIPRIPPSPETDVVFPCWVFDMVVSPASLTAKNIYFWIPGTSMAAPAVAAVAALILEKRPNLTPDQVFERLVRSADDRGARGFDAVYGNGRVNAFRAIR